jgi:RHS repeat-associated protein
VWKAAAEAFGKTTVDATATVTNNLRFPGQYYDRETNTHYNYYRDYDPGIGRYVQSDPIGLRGGINAYVYAYDPLTQVDPKGLMGRGSGAGTWTGVPKRHSTCGTGILTGPEFSFREACEAHDRCYDTCGANRFVCDDEFSRQAHESCPPGDMRCHTLAVIYYTLMKFGGMFFSFDAAQRETCKVAQCR